MPLYIAFDGSVPKICELKVDWAERNGFRVELPPVASGELAQRFDQLILPHWSWKKHWQEQSIREITGHWSLGLDVPLPAGGTDWTSTYPAMHLAAYLLAQGVEFPDCHLLVTAMLTVDDLCRDSSDVIHKPISVAVSLEAKLHGFHAFLEQNEIPHRQAMVITGSTEDPDRGLPQCDGIRDGMTSFEMELSDVRPTAAWRIQVCPNIKTIYDRLSSNRFERLVP